MNVKHVFNLFSSLRRGTYEITKAQSPKIRKLNLRTLIIIGFG